MSRAVLVAAILCSLTALGESAPARQSAAASGQGYAVFGPGVTDCGEFTNDLRTHRQSAEPWYMFYMQGFFSGANFLAMAEEKGNPEVGKDHSPQALFASVELYCAEHPLDRVSTAIQRTYLEVWRIQQK